MLYIIFETCVLHFNQANACALSFVPTIQEAYVLKCA